MLVSTDPEHVSHRWLQPGTPSCGHAQLASSAGECVMGPRQDSTSSIYLASLSGECCCYLPCICASRWMYMDSSITHELLWCRKLHLQPLARFLPCLQANKTFGNVSFWRDTSKTSKELFISRTSINLMFTIRALIHCGRLCSQLRWKNFRWILLKQALNMIHWGR